MSQAARHLRSNELLDYVSETASEEVAFRIDAHIADCRECRERVQALRHIQERFEEFWTSWSAAGHRRALEQYNLVKALQRAMAAPNLSERVAGWIGQLAGGAGVEVKLLLDRVKRVAMAATGILPPGFVFELRPAHPGVGSADAAKLNAHLHSGSRLLEADQPAEAMKEMLQAVRIDARAGQAATSEIRADDGRRLLQIVVDGIKGGAWVKCRSGAILPPPKMAALLPEEESLAAVFAEFRPEKDGVLAEFSEVADGTYRLVIGPIGPLGGGSKNAPKR